MTVYKVRTARSAGHARRYGYVLELVPPRTFVKTYMDVEGIGYWPIPARTVIERFHGWYKHKATAVQRAAELNRGQ